MTTLSFLAMTALAKEPLHGYGILQEVSAFTDNDTKPAVATMYRTLDRLETEGLVEEAHSEIVDGRFRRTYRLTEKGASVLSSEAKARSDAARVATRRLKQLSFVTPATPRPAGGAA